MSESAVAAIENGLEQLGDAYVSAFAAAEDEVALRNAFAAVLGKKGQLTKTMLFEAAFRSNL